jgi:anti-anti-sigma factor
MVTGDRHSAVTVSTDAVGSVAVLTAIGALDATTYLLLRDTIIKAALEEPQSVIVDIGELTISTESALAVFTSAQWHVGRWPEVPIALVTEHRAVRSAIARNGVARYVPVYATVREALAHSGHTPHRKRARADLPAKITSLRRGRDLVSEWLTAWSQPDLIAVSKIIVTAFLENVLQHTDSAPNVRLETNGTTVTVAVADASRVPPSVRESRHSGNAPTGLKIVAALCRAWGSSPTPSGKTVWAIVGPENRL